MSGHTPGPWVAHETLVLFPKNAGGFDIRNCPNPESNARLIAAAPDMLQALRRAVLALAFAAESSPAMQDDYEAVSAVIAKATGGAA